MPVAARDGVTLAVNPIRRVVTMLQNMQKKVTDSGSKEKVLFDKFMCYCTTGVGALEQSIKDAGVKVEKVSSNIEALEAEVGRLNADISAAKQDRADAEASLAEGKALRAKESAAYAKESSEFQTNIDAMGKAIAAIEKGAAGFLQTSAASVLRKISVSMDLEPEDRDMLSSFLSQGQNYSPASGQITGILKQMKDTMDADLKDATAAEDQAKADFEAMAAAKAKQIEALTKELEEKMTRAGDVNVELVNAKEDQAKADFEAMAAAKAKQI